jgi:hypothetical protein
VNPVTLKQTQAFQKRLTSSLQQLLKRIGRIQIGTPRQFPDGWGRAAKGRTVLRIVEEAVVQNIKARHAELGLAHAEAAPGETELYDVKVRFEWSKVDLFLNLKTAARGRETKKGDVSKADGIIRFFQKDAERQLFIVTLVVRFSADMFIEIEKCLVIPITWLTDIYVNPRNNNLQCCQPKRLVDATKRTNAEFIAALRREIDAADSKSAERKIASQKPASKRSNAQKVR